MKFSVDKQDGLVIYELLEEKLTSLNAPILKSELVLANAEGYKNEKGIFGLCGLNDTVKNLIKISQLEDVLHVYSTQHDAINAIEKKKKK